MRFAAGNVDTLVIFSRVSSALVGLEMKCIWNGGIWHFGIISFLSCLYLHSMGGMEAFL